MAVAERQGALVFTARDHCWKVGSCLLGIPNWALLGNATIVERAISEEELRLGFALVHPWFGRTFGYRGRFTLSADRRGRHAAGWRLPSGNGNSLPGTAWTGALRHPVGISWPISRPVAVGTLLA